MKLFTLAMGVVLIALAQQAGAQKNWVPELELLKTVSNGSVPVAIQHMGDSVAVGAFDSAYALNPNGSISYKILNLKNTIKKINGVWQSAGNAPLATETATLWYHNKIQGISYVSATRGITSNLFPFLRLNVVINQYEEINSLSFEGYPYRFYAWDGTKILLLGKAAGSIYKINGEIFRFGVVWNSQNNMLEHLSSSKGEGVYAYIDDQKDAGDTVFITQHFGGESHVWALKKGTSTWIESIAPSIAAHQSVKVEYINGKLYLIVGGLGTINNYDGKYSLFRLDGMVWTKLLELDPAGVYNYTATDPIVGMVYRNGVFYIAGKFAKADGKNVGPVVAYDESKDSVWSAAPMPAQLSGFQNPGIYLQGLYLMGNEVFLATTVGVADQFKGQTVFALKGTPPTAPAIAGLVGITNQTTIVDSGTATPGISVDYYVNDMKVQTVQANAAGKWKATFVAFGDGVYKRYAKARNEDGESSTSATLTVTIDTVPPAIATLLTPNHEAVFNKYQTITFKVSGVEVGAKVVFVTTATGIARLQYEDTVTTVANGTATLTRYFTEANGYEWTVYVVDAAGNMGQPPPQRNFTVTAVTGVEDPDDPNKVISLYPNPTRGKIWITNVHNLLYAVSIEGRKVNLPFTRQQASISLDMSNFSSGIYTLVCETFKKKTIILRVIKM